MKQVKITQLDFNVRCCLWLCLTSALSGIGWQDDKSRVSQLIYTFQVALCQLISTVCPVLTLYR